MTVNIAVSVSQASGSKFKPNKHHQLPLILSPLNGVMPENSGIIDATVAERMGLAAGQQAVIAITRRDDYVDASGKHYPNYQYTLVTKLGAGFENMIAKQVVASMNFGFSGGTPTPTPTPQEHVPVEEVESEEEEVESEGGKKKK